MPERLSIGADVVSLRRAIDLCFDERDTTWACDPGEMDQRYVAGVYAGKLERIWKRLAEAREALDKLGLREERRVNTEGGVLHDGVWLGKPKRAEKRLASEWCSLDSEPAGRGIEAAAKVKWMRAHSHAPTLVSAADLEQMWLDWRGLQIDAYLALLNETREEIAAYLHEEPLRVDTEPSERRSGDVRRGEANTPRSEMLPQRRSGSGRRREDAQSHITHVPSAEQ